MTTISELCYLEERCADTLHPSRGWTEVKKENGFYNHMNVVSSYLNNITEQIPDFNELNKQCKEWLIYLDKKYPKKTILRSNVLEYHDAENIITYLQSCKNNLLEYYQEPGTHYLKQDFPELFPEEILSDYPEITQLDIFDGYICILSHLPTPAAMILFRVVEHVSRLLYENITQMEPPRSLKEIINKLKSYDIITKSLLNYLDYLRDKRNEAEHPDKRFSLEESERIMLQLKGLILEIHELYEKIN